MSKKKHTTQKPLAQQLAPKTRQGGRRKYMFKPLSVQISNPTAAPGLSSEGDKETLINPDPGPETVLSGDTISPDVLLRHELFREGAVPPVDDSSPEKKKHKLAEYRLRNIKRNEDWSEVAVLDVLQIPQWFEAEKNDYNVKEYLPTKSITLDWIDNPGDDSKDIRARRFQAKQAPDTPASIWVTLTEVQAVVYRAHYECARACQRILDAPEPDTHNTGTGDSSIDSDTPPVKTAATKKTQKRRRSTGVQHCPVTIHLEIHANDLGKVHIWRCHSHKDAQPEALTWSRVLHRQAVELSRMEGATAGGIMKALTARLTSSKGISVPDHRRPTKTNIENIMPAARRRRQYAKNAFASLELYASQNTDNVFLYEPYRPKSQQEGESKLMCAVSDNFALASALLHASERGLFMDATWRGMNHNFAPTTFLLGVDENGHATPFGVLLSQDVQATTLEKFLKAWYTRLRAYAKGLTTNPGQLLQDFTEDQQTVITTSASQLVRSLWKPAFIMIDKDQAERNACKKAFPNVEVRVCQFHAIDTIQRWLNAAHPIPNAPARKPGKARKQFLVPKEAHDEILRAFRYTQRCRDAADFPAALNGFENALENICISHGITLYKQAVSDYFQENFWCKQWRDAVTDIGLPANQTRDQILNTNNYAESMIKTFKYLFLGMRRNKRVDTLVITITELFFPYYRIWRNDQARNAKDHVQATQLGYSLWSEHLVKKGKEMNKYTVNHVDGTKQRAYKVTWPQQPSCTCSRFQQTGKNCAHLWATQLFFRHGTFQRWAESTNPRMNEKAITNEDLDRNDLTPYDDDVVTIDENFAGLVESWYSSNAQSSIDVQDALEIATDKSPASVPESISPGAPPVTQSEFLPHVVNTGGHPAPQSPIRKNRSKRSYSEVLKSPPIPRSPSPAAPGHSPIFGRAHKRHASDVGGRSKFIMRLQESKRRIMAAPLDDMVAQAHEDLQRIENDFSTWDDPKYQLRIEEAGIIADVISQLAATLGFGAVVIADQGDTIANLIGRVTPETYGNIEAIQSSLPHDNALAQLLRRAASISKLVHILVLRVSASHWTLLDYAVENQSVLHYDSLPHPHRQRLPQSDRQVYAKFVRLMTCAAGTEIDPSRWPLESISTGHQPVDPKTNMVVNLSCGFWASLYAFLAVFNVPVKQRAQLTSVVDALRNVVIDYQANPLGGLTQDVMVDSFSQFIPNLKALLMHHESLQVWAPHLEKHQNTLAPQHTPMAPLPHNARSSTIQAQNAMKPRMLRDNERIQLQSVFNSKREPPPHFKLFGTKVSHSHFQSLRTKNWLSSLILDVVSSAFTSAEEHVWCTNTAFMSLLKESYSRVSRLQPYGKRSVDRVSIFSDVATLVIPFNEPIKPANQLAAASSISDHGTSGVHWAVIIIHLQDHRVTYRSSLMNRANGTKALEIVKTYLQHLSAKRPGDLGKYKESKWSFIIDDNTPQQNNGYDCGVFVVSQMLGARLHSELLWDTNDIAVLRARLAVQIMLQNLQANELVELAGAQAGSAVPHTPPHAFVTVTPHISRKRQMSPTPTPGSSGHPQMESESKPSSPEVKPPTKRSQQAPFPVKPLFAAVAQLAKKNTTIEQQLKAKSIIQKADALLDWNPDSDDDPNPDNLCPFCDSFIPDSLKDEFHKAIQPIIRLTEPASRLANPKGCSAKKKHFMAVTNFCIWHREQAKGSILDAAGADWPARIAADSLKTRVQDLIPLAVQLALDPQTGFAFEPLCKKWETNGRKFCMSPEGMFEASEIWGVSYYGPDGATIIYHALYAGYTTGLISFDWANWGGINDVNYALQNVLIPEVILRLIMEDMGVTEEKAKGVMESSKEYGTIRSRVQT